MFKLFLALLIAASQSAHSAQIPNRTDASENYVQRMYSAFLIQSIGETRIAYYCFKRAFQDAQIAGENPKKLALMNDLFVWYRKYGWSCGFMVCPARCSGECSSLSSFNTTPLPEGNENSQINYLSEWAKSPNGGKHIRSFLLGVAELGAAAFGFYIKTPMGLAIGAFLAQDCFSRCFDAINDGYADYSDFCETRKRELKAFERRANDCSKN